MVACGQGQTETCHLPRMVWTQLPKASFVCVISADVDMSRYGAEPATHAGVHSVGMGHRDVKASLSAACLQTKLWLGAVFSPFAASGTSCDSGSHQEFH